MGRGQRERGRHLLFCIAAGIAAATHVLQATAVA